jgi:hypothetical protein
VVGTVGAVGIVGVVGVLGVVGAVTVSVAAALVTDPPGFEALAE